MGFYVMCFLLVGLVAGLIAVASNPSSYFAALGLVVAAGMGCGVLVGHGGSFLSLVLFLIYLGGMLVVFAYSAALAAELYPESWGSHSVAGYVVSYLIGLVAASSLYWGEWSEASWLTVDEVAKFSAVRGDISGVAVMYSSGVGMLLISAWVLLLALFVVLELTRGLSRGALRAV
uniref:NADH dehydrogenase subunit 6 n=1 Tax=Lepophidium profundorum TaxID=334371 RepID=UPI0028D71612|nr:NADH dehydrogenase subunit 6 [Lepophidium profundorum]WMY90759.1 NADH dehydrogenase subunit 6 [Lepophidium profundorum]